MKKYFEAAWASLRIVNASRYNKIKQMFGSLEMAWKEAREYQLFECGFSQKHMKVFALARKNVDPQRLFEDLVNKNIQIVSIDDQQYPILLKEIAQPPVFMYVKGQHECLSMKSLSVVGTRKYSPYGSSVVHRFVPQLVKDGFCIVSGLAYGIDSIAHRVALNCGGKTVSVLPCAIDFVYPKGNASLLREIEERGCVLSEYPPGTDVMNHFFPERNRIVAGLSWGTLVVEAGRKSGALITADLALDANREVYAIPGSVFQSSFVGTHTLISKGEAKLVVDPESIIEDYSQLSNNAPSSKKSLPTQRSLPLFASDCEREIYVVLQNSGKSFEDLHKAISLPVAKLQELCTIMEMKGYIQSKGHGYWEVKA